MSTNPYAELDPFFIRGKKLLFLNPFNLQYLQHLQPTRRLPRPEVTHSAQKCKGVHQWCDRYIGALIINVILLLLVAGVLFGYYWLAPCVRGMACGDGNCVWESQWCDGVQNCPGGQDESSCLRLDGASSLLQASLQNGSWRSVCSSQHWTDHHGQASCQQIGYDRSTYVASERQQVGAADGGFFTVRPEWSPEVPILQQLVLSDACPGNSLVTLHCIVNCDKDCGRRTGVSGRLAGGPQQQQQQQQRVRGAWPWVVSLRSGGVHRCAGSIITPHWVVTAAHCVAGDPNPERWTLYAGIVESKDTLFRPVHSVSRIVAHEGFSRHNMRNDIALVKLSRPLNITASGDIGPVCLPNTGLNISTSQNCSVLGFGRAASEDSLTLMEAKVSLVDSRTCNSSNVYGGRITQGMICAQHKEGEDRMRQGDGGGPLVCEEGGVWWLVGDTSWEEEKCNPSHKPGVYDNVTHFLSWIYQQMKKYQH